MVFVKFIEFIGSPVGAILVIALYLSDNVSVKLPCVSLRGLISTGC